MEESTALWLLGLAHSEYEAVRSELDEAVRVSAALVRERDELREAHRKMLDERIALRDERDRAASQRDYLREELDRASDGASAERVHYLDQLEEQRVAIEALRDALREMTELRDWFHAECHRLGALITDTQRNLNGELIDVKIERDALRAELDTLKSAASGWLRVGDWAHANPDGRIVRKDNGDWRAEDARRINRAATDVDAARAAGWHDFPGASDHSAGAP